jgi:hypothetical protein
MLVERERPAHQARGVDRGCPLGTAVVRPMWHVSGTTGPRSDAAERPNET